MAELDRQPGTTYQDWLIRPDLTRKSVEAEDVNLRTPLTSYKPGVPLKDLRASELPEELFSLNAPFLTAPMQAVASPELFAEIAKNGGAGVANSSQPIESEADMVRRTKRKKAGFVEPDVVSPGMPIPELEALTKRKGYDTFPVTEGGDPHGRLMGIITRKDYSGQLHASLKVEDRMVSMSDPNREFTFGRFEELGDDLKSANMMLLDSHHGAMPIIDRDGNLHYMVFRKDIEQHKDNPMALVDGKKRYVVGAAVNTRDFEERAQAVIEAGADFIVVDSSQGYSEYQRDAILYLKRAFPGMPVIGGNIVTADGFKYLAKSGADVVKIGMGPGSICTTQHKFRIGMPMMDALKEVQDARNKYFAETGIYIPIIADGGIVDNADFSVALTLSDATMGGRFYAQFHESPAPVTDWKENIRGLPFFARVKSYWGEGSPRAKAWREGRYHQAEESEGIEGVVPYVGHLSEPHNFPRTANHLRILMQKCGYRDLFALQTANLKLQSASSKAQGMPHNIIMPEGFWAPYRIQ
ncbi:MAG: IMP dehydrogenase [archaeon GW2011_AR5]|nr:MAG: IMP dehydrogenase [archaeon GW2011_AR5]